MARRGTAAFKSTAREEGGKGYLSRVALSSFQTIMVDMVLGEVVLVSIAAPLDEGPRLQQQAVQGQVALRGNTVGMMMTR